MARRRKESVGSADVDIAPLIDVVFLLLVFFMSIWQAAHIEVDAELSLPLASQGNPELQQDKDRLIVNVDRQGHYYLAKRRLSERELEGVLQREAMRSRDAEGFARRPIFIRADADLPFRDVREVMLMCRKLRIWKVALRTAVPSEDEP
jgi:biopolymer transport protein ExbD